MNKLSELFYECAFVDNYQQVGDSVNYKFVEEGNTLYIFFEGSNSISDWVRNFFFFKKPYKDMKIPYYVHGGFLSAWKEVEDIIINKVQEKELRKVYNRRIKGYEFRKVYKWNHITIVGYSHGGALATFAHECVWYYRPDLREDGLKGYGFEAPRIYRGFSVKKALKERWKNFTIIRDGSDIVTHCPPSLFCFCHVGKILKIKGDTKLVKKKWMPKFVKYHYPEVVYDALVKHENEK